MRVQDAGREGIHVDWGGVHVADTPESAGDKQAKIVWDFQILQDWQDGAPAQNPGTLVEDPSLKGGRDFPPHAMNDSPPGSIRSNDVCFSCC